MGATYLVVELVDCLAKKILTLSVRLQEAHYNSEEDFKKVWVVFIAINVCHLIIAPAPLPYMAVVSGLSHSAFSLFPSSFIP